MKGKTANYARRIALDAFVFLVIGTSLLLLFNIAGSLGIGSNGQFSQFTSLYSLSFPHSNLAIIALMLGIFLTIIAALAFFYFVIPNERKSPKGEYELAKKVFKEEDERPYTTF